ncbi:glycoside hydrolase family 5 protein [Phytoactinopolyspora alkaliphila]|uniref:Glycoside hydrolase family 5 protein n=1 Tax=Phytoactinopolyspora alkaliphila TaxID=1783498 RepID=A0A6N9YH90_9ACTN|nr:cellulase family glycosylhydrolase [Phytoactinopolyspora alkaliphila]NED94297.1 glycoside hydrolase family 5 protein [Phytoactinopolyspora alkaliphila]
MTMSWLRIDGDRLADERGEGIALRGFGLGGWMNMENFITGYPGTESQVRAAMKTALGEDGYRRFFDRFLRDFFTDDDAALLASLGLNCLRVPFNYRHFEDDDAPFELKETGFQQLDRLIAVCARHGIYTILDLHAAPGHQNHHWHSDNPTHQPLFWTHRHFQDRVVHLWEALAGRYHDNPAVAGYNPLNEPADESGEVIGPFYARLERAIRAVDRRHILFLDGNRYSSDFSVFGEPVDNAVYTAHDYALPGIARDSEYPGITRGEFFDRDVVEKTFLRRTEFMRRTGTPIWIGEFGPIYTGDPRRDAACADLLRDQLDIYRAHGASWSLWTYKDIGRQGLAFVPPESPYLQQIKPSLEQKERLGTDSWGGSDAQVRHILEPIETLIADEFPDFAPYPWGQRQWIPLLIRNIMFAEPAAERFGRCFEGVTPAQAEDLASAFALSRCTVRTELAEVLKAHVAA